MIASRGSMVFVSIIAGLYILIIPSVIMQRSAVKELDSLRSKYKELAVLEDEYKTLKGQVDVIEQKSVLKQSSGIANTIDGITSSIGLKGKVKSIKGIGNREMKGPMSEESAEVRLEKMSMNELVNMFYKIGDAPFILSVKKAQIKKTFENPELFDVSMSLSLFTKK